MIHLKLINEFCKGCALCVVECPHNVLELSDSFNGMGYHPVKIRSGAECSGCLRCAVVCPEVAIEIYKVEEPVESKKINEGK